MISGQRPFVSVHSSDMENPKNLIVAHPLAAVAISIALGMVLACVIGWMGNQSKKTPAAPAP